MRFVVEGIDKSFGVAVGLRNFEMGKILVGPSKDWVCVPACSVVEKILAVMSEWRRSGEALILMVWLTRIVSNRHVNVLVIVEEHVYYSLLVL